MGGGGAERQLAYLATELVAFGWDIHVALVSGGPNLERLQRSGATIHWLPSAGNYDPRLLWNVTRLIDRVAPDLVQVWMLQMEVIGAIGSTMRGVPLIWSERCSEAAYPDTVKHRIRQHAARRAVAVVANSEDGCEYWTHRLDPAVPRHAIPNALPLREISVAEPVASAESRLPASETLILFAGRLTEQKNPETLLRALIPLLQAPGRTAVIAGEGPLAEQLRLQAAQTDLAERVRFPGYLTNLWAWMKRANVFVSPSFFEGHPNTVLEAAANRCPLVISDIRAHREFLDERSALFVNPHEADALTAAIEEVLGARERAQERVDHASRIVARWSTEHTARRYEAVYFDVMEKAGRPR
jgi:glycosyltransferase involved in cell wall biosynthesis